MAASPAPKVFSAVRGFETFSSRLFVEWDDGTGRTTSVAVDSDLYAKLRGPYLRRNVFGAALAYGPVLPPELRDPVIRYGLCNQAPLLEELGISMQPSARNLRVRWQPRPETGEFPRTLGARCD